METGNLDPTRRPSFDSLDSEEKAAIDELTKVGKRGSYLISGEQTAEKKGLYKGNDVKTESSHVQKAVAPEGKNKILEEKGGFQSKGTLAVSPKITRQVSGTDFGEWPVYHSEDVEPQPTPEKPHSNVPEDWARNLNLDAAAVKRTETPDIGTAGKLTSSKKTGRGLLNKIAGVFKREKVVTESDWKAKADFEKKTMESALKVADSYLATEKIQKVLLAGNDKSLNLFLADRGVKIDHKDKQQAAQIFNEYRGAYLNHIAILASKKLTVENMTEMIVGQLLKTSVGLEIAQRQAAQNLSLDEEEIQLLSKGDIAGKISQSLKQANDGIFMSSKSHVEADFAAATAKEVRVHHKDGATLDEFGSRAVGGLKVGYACTTNFKSPPFINEDRHLESMIRVGNEKVPLLAVFDGHGGSTTSEFLKRNLDQFIENEFNSLVAPLTDDKIFLALNQAFLKCNRVMFESKKESDYSTLTDGATATVGIVLNGDLWVASVGDSRAIVIGSKGEVIGLNQDAEPTITKFKDKIEQRGGEIINGRVNGELGVATAFGDFHLKGMSVIPEVTKFSLAGLGGNPLFLVGCDGLFDAGTSQEVGLEAYKLINQGKSPKAIAETLALKARNVDTHAKKNADTAVTNDDDITVVCTFL